MTGKMYKPIILIDRCKYIEFFDTSATKIMGII